MAGEDLAMQEEEKSSVRRNFSLMIEDELRERIKQQAKTEARSLSSMARLLILRGLADVE